MKKSFLTVLTLVIITSLSGFLLYSVNEVTSPIIEKNMQIKVDNLAKEIFTETSLTQSTSIDNEFVTKEIKCLNKDNEVIGYLYQASGNNSFGNITLLIGFMDDKVVKVEFLTLNQSYSNVAYEHTESTYNTSKVLISDLDKLNLKSGATYSSTLINNLIKESAKVYGDHNA